VALRVVFRPQAEDEVLEVREWYELRRAGLGYEFGQAVNSLVQRIITNPPAYTTKRASQSSHAFHTPSIFESLRMRS
jgi:hypothetical protein